MDISLRIIRTILDVVFLSFAAWVALMMIMVICRIVTEG